MKTSFSYDEIRKKGYKLTEQRKVILGILQKANSHLSADEIYLQAKMITPGIGLTTVYRTLEVLQSLGYVNRYDFGEGRARYELNGEIFQNVNHHHHLICISCNKVIDYRDFVPQETELIEKTIGQIFKKYGFKVQAHIVQFYGICRKCYQKIKTRNGRI